MILLSGKRKTKPVAQGGCILKNAGSKGMTLLEMLVALGLFAFMFAFIAQIVRQNHRQVRKISQDVQWKSSLSNTLDLMRSDFRGVAYFLDINENLRIHFSKTQDQKDSSSSDAGASFRTNSQARNRRSIYPVNLSPYFVFKGRDDDLQFASHSFSSLKVGDSSSQWIQVRYFVESCDSLEGKGQSSCLIRSVSRYWHPDDREEPDETLVLFRGFDSLDFSYSDAERDGPSKRKWKNEWESEKIKLKSSPLIYPSHLPFPYLIRIRMTKGDHSQAFYFPISSSYLKVWNPHDKFFPGFPHWNPPKKNEKKKSKGSGRSRR